MRENSRTTSPMDEEFIDLKTAPTTMANSKMANLMAKEN
jgi:hypothetical protein